MKASCVMCAPSLPRCRCGWGCRAGKFILGLWTESQELPSSQSGSPARDACGIQRPPKTQWVKEGELGRQVVIWFPLTAGTWSLCLPGLTGLWAGPCTLQAGSPGHENNKRRWTSGAPDLPPAWALLASSPTDSFGMFFSVNKTHRSTKETNYSDIPGSNLSRNVCYMGFLDNVLSAALIVSVV